jgi:hypothetical protein
VRARRVRNFVLVALVVGAAGGRVARAQQDLGHKTLGTIGLDAGELPEPASTSRTRSARTARMISSTATAIACPSGCKRARSKTSSA